MSCVDIKININTSKFFEYFHYQSLLYTIIATWKKCINKILVKRYNIKMNCFFFYAYFSAVNTSLQSSVTFVCLKEREITCSEFIKS